MLFLQWSYNVDSSSPVYTVFILDIVQTVFGTHQAWYYSVANWNNGPALVGASPWSAATIPIMAGLSESSPNAPVIS
jgi:hypothetical protein